MLARMVEKHFHVSTPAGQHSQLNKQPVPSRGRAVCVAAFAGTASARTAGDLRQIRLLMKPATHCREGGVAQLMVLRRRQGYVEGLASHY